MAIFRATRALEGTPRWAMALADDNVSTNGILGAFSCALGVQTTADTMPRLRALLGRANVDTLRPAGLEKQYQHLRPFQVESGKVCLSDRGRTALESDPDYPSGHDGELGGGIDPRRIVPGLVRDSGERVHSERAGLSVACTTPAPSKPAADGDGGVRPAPCPQEFRADVDAAREN
jgi:hypothetical protein